VGDRQAIPSPSYTFGYHVALLLIKGIAVIPVVFLGWTLYALIVAPVVLFFALLGGLVAFAVQIFLRRGLHEGRP
jgi:hypothetical protein